MKDFLEKRLGIEIMLEDINFEDRLPLLYISLYTFKLVQTYGVEWIIIIPKEQVHLSKLYANVLAAKGALESAVNSFAKLEKDGFRKIMTARIIASENSIENANIAMRIGGGQAYNRKGNIERLMRDAYASQVMFPSIDVLKSWVGKDITGNSIL